MAKQIIGSLADLLEFRYGVKTTHRINPTGNTVIANIVLPILGSNPKRLGYVILNMGDNPCWIAPRDAVADDYGLELVANGGSISMRWNVDFELVTLPWYIVSGLPGTVVFAMEVMIY